jgi:hypothetical protein
MEPLLDAADVGHWLKKPPDWVVQHLEHIAIKLDNRKRRLEPVLRWERGAVERWLRERVCASGEAPAQEGR